MKLRDALAECTLALLRRIAASHGVAAGDETLRGEFADLLSQRLAEPGYLPAYLASLPQEEIELLQTVGGRGWMAKGFVVERQVGKARAEASPAAGTSPSRGTLSLLHKGLLFRTFAPIGDWRGEVYHVPEELRSAIPVPPPSQDRTAWSDLRASTIPEIVEDRDGVFDVFCLLSFLQRGDWRPHKGGLSKSDLASLEREASAIPVGEGPREWEERWRFLLHLCLAGGWVRRDGATLKPSRNAGRLLSGEREQVRARLLHRYLKDRSWSDLAAAGRVRQPVGARAIDEVAARQLLLHYLEELAADGWTDESAFRRALRSLDPDFLRQDHASPSWAVMDVSTEAELYGAGSWEIVEGEWIRCLLRGPLRWLGAIKCGRTGDGRMVGFRLSSSVAAAAGAQAPGTRGAPADVTVREDMEVQASADCDLGLLLQLEPYLELKERGRRSSYRVTRSSVLAGLEKSGSLEQLLEMLRLAAPESLPSNVVAQISEWAASYGRFSLEAAILLVAGSPEDAELLRQLPGTTAALHARLGPTSYRIVPERAWEIAEKLKRAGYPPRIDPRVRLALARGGASELALLKECLFALRVLRSLDASTELENGVEAQRRLEALLDPEDAGEVSRRAQEAVKGLRAGRTGGRYGP